MPPIGRLFRTLGAIGGGAAGVATTEEDQDPFLRGAAGAVGGGLLGPAAWTALGRPGATAMQRLSDYTYFSMLSSPDTMIRAGAGAIGGALSGALEKAAVGEFKNAANIIRSIASKDDGIGLYFRALAATPDQFKKLHQEILGTLDATGKPVLESIEQHQLGRGIGKLFAAPDLVAVKALKKGGFSADEAARYTLTGKPQSVLGKGTLSQLQKFRKAGGIPEFAAVQSAPFARVGILGLEKGLERLPLLGGLPTTAGKAVKQGIGLGAMGTGYFGEDHIDPRIMTVLGPLAGPAYFPHLLGRELRRQKERGPLTPGAITRGVGEAAKETNPFGFQPFSLFTSAGTQLPRRILPAGLADIAETIDPAFGRESTSSEIQRLIDRGEYAGDPELSPWKARIPGLRETLPEQFAPVDVFGRPRYQSPYAIPGADQNALLRGLSKAVFPARQFIEPAAMPQSDPMMAQLRELGLRLQPPTSRVMVPRTGIPLQQTAQSAAATQRVAGISPQIASQIVTQIMSQPGFQAMAPAQRNYIARMLMDRIRGRLSRALGSARLATALSQGAQIPSTFGQP